MTAADRAARLAAIRADRIERAGAPVLDPALVRRIVRAELALLGLGAAEIARLCP